MATTQPSSYSGLSTSASVFSTSAPMTMTTTEKPQSSSSSSSSSETTTTTTIMTPATAIISTVMSTFTAPETKSVPTLLTMTVTASTDSITYSDTTSSNMTEEEIQDYLSQLQDQEFLLHIPALVYLVILGVTGLCGNTMVLLVYRTKFHRTPTRIFIMTIAAFDLVSNVWCIPVEVTDMFYLWNFPNLALCKMLRFSIASTTITSACILLAVSVSRYRKICRPFGRQVTVRHAQTLSVCIAVFGCVVSIPFGIINGYQSRPTPIPGVYGLSCSISDHYLDTIWPLINNGFFLLLFLSLCTPLVVLYVLIGIQAFKHSAHHGIPTERTKTSATPTCTITETEETIDDHISNRLSRFFKRTTRKYRVAHSKSISKTQSTEEISTKYQDKTQKKKGTVHCETGQDSCVKMERSLNEDKAIINFSKAHEINLQLNNMNTDESACSNERHTDCDIASSAESENDKDETKKEGGGITESCGDLKTSPSDTNTSGDSSGLEKTGAQNGSPGDKDGDDGNGEANVGLASRVQGTDITFHRRRHDEGGQVTENPLPGSTNVNNKSNGKEHGHSVVKIQDTKTPHRSVINRTTCMLILITAAYVLSFIPYLTLMFFRFTLPEAHGAMGPSSLMAHHLFLRFYFVNSAVNPIIYSFCDVKFRQEAIRVLRCYK